MSNTCQQRLLSFHEAPPTTIILTRNTNMDPPQGPSGPARGAGPNPNLNPIGLRLDQYGPHE